MGQSLVKAYYHIVFSTKGRAPFIDEEIAPLLYEYLFGICRELECYPCRIGGHLDHVHILCQLSKKITIVHLLESIEEEFIKVDKAKETNFDKFLLAKWLWCIHRESTGNRSSQ